MTTLDEIERLALQAREVDDAIDNGRWMIGDLICQIDDPTGENLKEFARASQIKVATVRKYRRMSAFYPENQRDYIKDTFACNYDIMDQARVYANDQGEDWEGAIDFLNICNAQGALTVDHVRRMSQQLRGIPPRMKQFAKCHATLTRIFIDSGLLEIETDLPPEIMQELEYQQYTIVIYEKGETDDLQTD